MARHARVSDADSATTVEVDATYGPASLRQFDVALDNFTGPFDLLLRLIANRQMDLTDVALAAVTDEFLGYIRHRPDLSSATDFLVVAATLLHMKAAALLPHPPGDEDILDEDLEARDVLFARLLQYRAIQQAAEELRSRWERHAATTARAVPLQEPYASLLPELRWTTTASSLAELAAAALMQKQRPDEAEHVAHPAASFDDELALVATRLRDIGTGTFASIVADAESAATVVTRFLAVLQLYRDGLVDFHQSEPMAALEIRWKGNSESADNANVNVRLDQTDDNSEDINDNLATKERGGDDE